MIIAAETCSDDVLFHSQCGVREKIMKTRGEGCGREMVAMVGERERGGNGKGAIPYWLCPYKILAPPLCINTVTNSGGDMCH